MSKKLLIVLVICGAALGANAQSIPTEWSTRYQTVMDSLINNFQSDDNEPIGISMAVNVPGIGIWQGASGIAALGGEEPNIPMTTGMTAGIGSNSKLFTAVILLKLQEANLLSLDDQIGQYITEDLHDIDRTATIRQLLNHETGITDFINDREDAFYDDVVAELGHYWTIAETVDNVTTPHFAKGTAFRYSNTNYALAAWIIERVTNNSYAYNLHQYITTPLGLTRTFDVNEATALNGTPEAGSYMYGIWYERLGYPAYFSQFVGSASIVSTPEDMAAFYQGVFGNTFFTPESKQQLLTFDAASQYGLGVENFQSASLQREDYHHDGAIAGFLSEATYDPMTGASMFWVINNRDAQEIFIDFSLAMRREYRKGYPKQVNDAGIERIVSPRSTLCVGAITPVVILKNYGSAPLTSATIKYQVINNANVFTYNWTGNLASGAAIEVTLSTFPVNQNNNHTLKIWTESPNGTPEGYTFNDEKTSNFTVITTGVPTTSFSENFESGTTAIKVWNPNHVKPRQWGITKLTGSSGNHSLATVRLKNVSYGDESIADLPIIRLIGNNALTFKYAYSHWEEHENRLQVELSDDCGATWNTLFNRSGTELSQGLLSDAAADSNYFPHSTGEWHTETISLGAYAGSDVQIRFKRIMDATGGDNLYLDDIYVGSSLGAPDFFKYNVTVYPNPANDKVTVSGLPDDTVVSLYNMSGQRLLEVVANGDTAIDISNLAQGMYFLNTSIGSAKIVKK